MSMEASVAPKERVNIVYRPAIDGVEEDVELSMRSLVLGEFTPKADPVPLVERKAINVDKDNFDAALKGQNLTLTLSVPNCLDEKATEDDLLNVDLSFESLADFTPDSIVTQVPELKQMIELREALKALKSPLGNVPQFRKRLAEIIRNPETRAQLLNELDLSQDQ